MSAPTFSSDGPIFTQSGDFASKLAASATQDLMTLQASVNAPESTNVSTTTDPLLPDKSITDRLAHMDPELYDLTDNSHLMRLLKVLLGGAGGGGLRKQIGVARLQNGFNGMHFLDLDRFYGALFGIVRTQAEILPDFGTLGLPAQFDPYTDAAGSDAWDDVHSRDASYRDRIVKFAKALSLGGSYPGLRAAAEALFSVDCEIYESWIWVDEQNAAATQPPVLIYTYSSVSALYPTWAAMQGTHTFRDVAGSSGASGGGYFLGRTGQQNRSEVLIQPKRQIRPDEQFEAQRVIDRLKPAGTQFTIDPNGLAIHNSVPIRGVAADSEYWEIIYSTTPAPALVDPAPTQPIYVQPDPKQCQPRPAFSNYQGEKWCHNDSVTVVTSYQMIQRSIITSTNYQTCVFASGKKRSYLPSHCIMDGDQIRASRSVSDGVMTSYPYAGRNTYVESTNARY